LKLRKITEGHIKKQRVRHQKRGREGPTLGGVAKLLRGEAGEGLTVWKVNSKKTIFGQSNKSKKRRRERGKKKKGVDSSPKRKSLERSCGTGPPSPKKKELS